MILCDVTVIKHFQAERKVLTAPGAPRIIEITNDTQIVELGAVAGIIRILQRSP
jgi:hypothetical protein